LPRIDFLFGVPYSHKTHKITAETIEEALETFCSSIDAPEELIGRLILYEDDDSPIGYNLKGHKFDTKPTLPSTSSLPDTDVIQVWVWDEKKPHWNLDTPGDYRLVFELPLADLWKYDRWGNVEHPALPAPEVGNLPETDITALDIYRGKKIRQLTRADIAQIRRELSLKRKSIEEQANKLALVQRVLGDELQFRTEQLKWIYVYLGKNFNFVRIKKGKDAPDTTKLTLRQRVLYMAEEVGIIGGYQEIDFRNIEAFDEWASKPENLAIICPEEKCVVALKPRRDDVAYSANSMLDFFLNLENHLTYFLIRNGENVWRVFANIAVGTKVFPEPETFQHMYHRKLEIHAEIYNHPWNTWERYQEKIRTREKWKQKLGVTDKDFRHPLEFKTKAEFEAAQLKQQHRVQEPEIYLSQDEKLRVMQSVYEDYQRELKDYFFALAFIQGLIDRTQIFGNLAGKVNVFTGAGIKEYCELIYDATPEKLLEDKATPTVEDWLKEEAKNIIKGDYVVILTDDERQSTGLGKVVRVVTPGKIIAHTLSSWGQRGRNHNLLNDEDLNFFPFKLPADKLNFYLERRQDRDKYWKTLLKHLFKVKMMRENKEKPELSKASERIVQWTRGEKDEKN